MFHMLTCFDLKPGHSLDAFESAMAQFTSELRALDLVERCGPVGRRHRDTILDTDQERDHDYFVLMHFRDRAQSDRAVDYIMRTHRDKEDASHVDAYAKTENLIFICWEDV